VEFVGRADGQVKVRGFRVELGEVEAALASVAGVRQAVVVAREGAGGEKRLVAYVVPEDKGREMSVGEVRGELGERLPEYMVPGQVVMLGEMPLTVNGKVDRGALIEAGGYVVEGSEYVAPGTAVEEVLCGMWAEVLEVERVGVHDNFFELGGHSLLAASMASRLREIFPLEVSLYSLFQCGTVEKLADYIGSEAAQAGVDVEALARVLVQLNNLSAEEVAAMLDERESALLGHEAGG
jgi:acyl carrier protein